MVASKSLPTNPRPPARRGASSHALRTTAGWHEPRRPGWRSTTSTDGTPLGWCRTDPARARGRAAVPLVLCNGIACSIGYWTTLTRQMRDERPVVQWDYRGHGVSGVPADHDAVTIDHIMADLEAVLRAADVERAVVVGHSFGVQVALEAARRWPERVAAVVAIAGAAGAPVPAGASRPALRALTMVERLHARIPDRAEEAWRNWWRNPLTHLAAHAIGGTSMAVPPSIMRAYYEHVSTRNVPLLVAMLRSMQAHDASDVVPTLEVPLLALAGDADRLTPLPIMTRFLDAPHGELAVCHGAAHTLPAERPAWVLQQLRTLLNRVDAAAARRPTERADPPARHANVPAGA